MSNKISVFGLGNVGLVAALGLCELGFEVTGVEINPEKVKSLQAGKLYILEAGLPEVFAKNQGRFVATTSHLDAASSDCMIICVGTPGRIDGEVNLTQIENTTAQIAEVMSEERETLIILRSTVPPGTIRSKVLPVLENSGKPYKLIYHPEFLREGTALNDFLSPHLHVIGTIDGKFPDYAAEFFTNCPKIETVPFESAEMVKYMNNCFHALKVSFVNEVASLASSMKVEVEPLVKAFLADDKLNISSSYLRPGFAFGGPCLTKELKAINSFARHSNVETPLLKSILNSNNEHIMRSLRIINRFNPDNIIFFGVSFKEGTDDLRFSPIIDLINLLQKGPTYLKKRTIYVRERDLTKEYLTRMSDCHVVSECLEMKDEIHMAVLGPLELTSADMKWLESFNGIVLDLGYPQHNKVISNHSGKLVRAYEVI